MISTWLCVGGFVKAADLCSGKPEVLPAALHDAVVKAEKTASTGHYKKAFDDLALYLKEHPDQDFAYPYYDLGYFKYQSGQLKTAIEPLKKAVKRNPCFTEAWQLLAKVYHEIKMPEPAADAMAHAASLSGDMQMQYQTALLWMEAEKPQKALPILDTLAKEKKPRSEWLVALSNALQALKKKKETAEAMERAARMSNRPDLMFHAAWLWLEAEQPKNALELLKILSKQKKPKIEWLLVLANTCVTLKHFEDAARTMDRVITMEGKPEHLYNGGLLWLQMDRPGKALRHLMRLSRLPEPEADWFVAIAHAWIQSENISKAVDAMERAAQLSQKPEHTYQAGILRLQLKQADRALKLLLPLARLSKPNADWMVAISNAWMLKAEYGSAADAMEKAARISRKPDHFYRAAQLWLQDEKPKKAIVHLKYLASLEKPEGKWLLTLSGTHLMLNQTADAAGAMERAASITGQGDHYYRAAMLWRQENRLEKTIRLLQICARKKPVRQRWLVDLATVLLEVNRKKDAEQTMARTILTDDAVPEDVRYQGAVLWLNLQRPENALPVLNDLCASPDPDYKWLVSLVKTQVELGQLTPAQKTVDRLLGRNPEKTDAWDLSVWVALQKPDYAAAAAALEVAVALEPDRIERNRELSRLYQMAGVPVKAAEAFRKTLGDQISPADWDHIVDIYLSGRRYDLAVEPARAALQAKVTARRLETLGDITYHLHRYQESAEAYERATSLSDTPELRLKAGYAFMKMNQFDPAADHFETVVSLSEKNSPMVQEASQYLEYIRQMRQYNARYDGNRAAD